MRRREFLKAGLAVGAVFGAPSVIPSRVLGAYAPSNRITVGFIGLGNQSTVDLPAFLKQPDAQVVAVCDVNTGSVGYNDLKRFLGRKPGQEKVNAFYAEKTASGKYQGCDAYNDFRDVLAREDVDAVALVVPDHWHGLMTVMAARAGKDIYCEKPLSLTVADGQMMVRVVREHKRILQTGSHFRSGPMRRFVCELVRNERIGKLKRIYTVMARNNAESPGPGWKPMPVPEGFDYDMWLGRAPWAPYHSHRCFYRFRFLLDYSGGQTTNFGAHALDVAQWGHGSDATGPVEFEDTGSEFPPEGSLFTTATKIAFRAKYADGVELVGETGDYSPLTRFEGTEGWLQIDHRRGGTLTAHPESLKTAVIGPNEIHLPKSNPARTEDVYREYIPDHVGNFLASVKSREDPIEPVEVGHRTASICHLANIAMLLKRKIRWDPEKEEIGDDAEASAMLSRPMREPWEW